ncbi:hypothetical protein R80B4_02354 [Fibrobacteres bacterium R8-0-B4]
MAVIERPAAVDSGVVYLVGRSAVGVERDGEPFCVSVVFHAAHGLSVFGRGIFPNQVIFRAFAPFDYHSVRSVRGGIVFRDPPPALFFQSAVCVFVADYISAGERGPSVLVGSAPRPRFERFNVFSDRPFQIVQLRRGRQVPSSGAGAERRVLPVVEPSVLLAVCVDAAVAVRVDGAVVDVFRRPSEVADFDRAVLFAVAGVGDVIGGFLALFEERVAHAVLFGA